MFGYKLVKKKDLIKIGNFNKALNEQKIVIDELMRINDIIQVSDLQESIKSDLWKSLVRADCSMLLTGMYLLPEGSLSSLLDEDEAE